MIDLASSLPRCRCGRAPHGSIHRTIGTLAGPLYVLACECGRIVADADMAELMQKWRKETEKENV